MARITSVEALPVRLPRRREQALRTAGSPTGLMDTGDDYRWSTVVPALYPVHFETALVKLTTDEGVIGWGEAQAPLAPQIACGIVNLLLRPAIRGCEFSGRPEEIEALWDRMYRTMRVRGQTGGFMLDAISGVDLALWDLAGKMQQQPVCRLIAKRAPRRAVPAYFSGLPGTALAERLKMAETRGREGFRQIKVFHDAGVEELYELLGALRARLGPAAGLAVDALWRLSPEEAVAFGRKLDQIDALWLEAPLLPEDPAAHARLAASIRTPLALGESYRTRFELEPFFRLKALAYVQPDLGRCGITEGLRIAAMAADAGVAVAPHVSIAMGPQIAAAVHFAAACESCPMLEFNPSVLEMANRFLEAPLEVKNGSYTVPEGPGLGIEMKERELRAALAQQI